VRDFDQLLAALCSMIEIVRDHSLRTRTFEQFTVLSHWRNDEMHSWFKMRMH
jgi:hypothetical protein